MVGNDIVDLSLAKTQSNWERTGFLDKQFTKKEQESILSASDSFLQVWQFWSMKEAAYKCYTQKVERRFFAPKKFECTLDKVDKGMVVFEDHRFYTATFFSTSYIHTIAENIFAENTEKLNVFIGVGNPTKVNDDITLRLQEKTGLKKSEIEKRKTKIGAPMFYHQEKLLTKSCSISHHGNYGGFAFTLENES